MNPFELFKSQHETTNNNRPFLWGSGTTDARVMLLGMGPDSKATTPFSIGDNSQLRVINFLLGVPDTLLYYNYLLKVPANKKYSIDFQRNILSREINEFCKPRAVVLFGEEVLFAVTGIHSKLGELRRNRLYSTRYPNVNFFLTHAMADVAKDELAVAPTGGRLQKLSAQVSSDLSAVYETNPDYFMTARRF